MDSGFTDAVRIHAYLFFNHIVRRRRIFPILILGVSNLEEIAG